MTLLQKWGVMEHKPWKIPQEIPDMRIGISLRPVRLGHPSISIGSLSLNVAIPYDIAQGLLFIVSALNVALFCWIFEVDPLAVKDSEYFIAPFALFSWSTDFWYLFFILIPFCLYPVIMVVLLDGAIILMVIFLLALGVTLPVGLSLFFAGWMSSYEEGRARGSDRENWRFAPACSGLMLALLGFIAYFGLGAERGLSYDCSTTRKGPFYDLLGRIWEFLWT